MNPVTTTTQSKPVPQTHSYSFPDKKLKLENKESAALLAQRYKCNKIYVARSIPEYSAGSIEPKYAIKFYHDSDFLYTEVVSEGTFKSIFVPWIFNTHIKEAIEGEINNG